MRLVQILFCVSLIIHVILSDTTVNIYNEFLSQGGRVKYEVDRWNKYNGLAFPNLVSKLKALGGEAGRVMNYDIPLFSKWPQNPHHHGYPDPQYIQDQNVMRQSWTKYMDNIHGYGHDINMVFETKSLAWPSWIDKSHHKGKFPNNIDAAAEFVSLMVQGLKDYSGGHIPPYFEVINEPFAQENLLDTKTVIDYHKAVAQKLKTRFGLKVGGPTYTAYHCIITDREHFQTWNRTTQFIDLIFDQLDFFSFHSYNNFYVTQGKNTKTGNPNHRWTGMNEARLVAFVDMVEGYAHIKKNRNIPLIVSEFGRNAVVGTSEWTTSDIVNFATVFKSCAHMFTFLNLREFMERAIVFILAHEGPSSVGGQHNSVNWSFFTADGRPLKNVNYLKFWQHLGTDHKFLKVTSPYTGSERTVSPLALANPKTKELVVLLVNYGQDSQDVNLNFPGGWIHPTTGQSTCLVYENDKFDIHSNVKFDTTKNHGKVVLPAEGVCMYTFTTNFNFGSLRTNNENTYYGRNMVIPINNGHAQTTIHLPSSNYHSAHMRIGVSRELKSQKAKPTSVTINGSKLPSSYMLFDNEKIDGKTRWEVWAYSVPAGNLKSTNTISMQFEGNGGHVSSVALIVGKLQ